MKARDIRLVVCAAIKNKEGLVICGPKHWDCLNFAHKLNINILETWECGFVDQNNKFMTRSEAWVIADKAGQIRRPTGLEKDYSTPRPANIGDTGLLFSENLY